MDMMQNLLIYLGITCLLLLITYLCIRRSHWIASLLLLGASSVFVLGIGRVVVLV